MPSLLESADVSGFTPVRKSVRDRKEREAVVVLGRSELTAVEAWPHAFSHLRKDSRYYEIVEDTVCPEFNYRYFAIKTKAGDICAIQPFFVLDQDLLAGAGPRAKAFAEAIRRFWPRFLTLRTLMVGCAAGEGHLPAQEPGERLRQAQLLAANISNSGAPRESFADRAQGVSGPLSRFSVLFPVARFFDDAEHADDASRHCSLFKL